MPARILTFVSLSLIAGQLYGADPLDYEHVAPIFTKYCAGCHNAEEVNGEFSLESYATLIDGGESGPAITPGSAASSRLIQMVLGSIEPKMPPEDEPAPGEAEIQMLIDWVESGATGPAGGRQPATQLRTPKIEPHVAYQPITALAYSNSGRQLAVARFGQIEIRDAQGQHVANVLAQLPGKVTGVTFAGNDQYVVAATGVVGLYGEAILCRIADGKAVRRYRGHRDLLYSANVSHDQRFLVTSGYDRKAVLWDFDTGEQLRDFVGHNGAVFAAVFDRDAEVLATASADATVKVWRVTDAMRLDTRSEPLKEQYTVAISPDANWVVAGGEDNRIRKWRLLSRDVEQINPLEVARFGHESAVQLLRFRPDGQQLVSVGNDGAVKIWSFANLEEVDKLPQQTESVQALAVSQDLIALGRMDGSLDVFRWPVLNGHSEASRHNAHPPQAQIAVNEMHDVTESEPNDSPDLAKPVAAPFRVRGTIHAEDGTDVDMFRFPSPGGQQWMVEVKAAREKSPLDSHVAVLNADGRPIPRVLLQAVRDSYFTFRGKNSDETGDFRLHNWEEMRLNQLLYCNGEVVRLYHYPRGPDSGYNVFPNTGKRYGMFDTTPITHALHEPCYIVEAHEPTAQLKANGLPTFLLHYENDDDSERELGKDSRLTFTAPVDGEYLVRVRDTRGFQGEDFSYELTVRPPQPRFTIRHIHGANPGVGPGSGKKFGIEVDRIDGFDGPVDVQVLGLPEGYSVAGNLTIEAGQLQAWATLQAADNATPMADEATAPQVVATAKIGGQELRQTKTLGKIKLEEAPKLLVELIPKSPSSDEQGIPLMEIRAGQTTTAHVEIVRRGHDGRVNFGKESALLNVPFGVFVDNTGLNGVLINEHESNREFFVTAEAWVQPQQRVVFVEAAEAGRPTSNPVLLRVLAAER